MEWSEYQAKLQQINNPETDAETRAILFTEITEDYSSTLKTIKDHESSIETLNDYNEKLVKANTHLTLSVGDSFSPPESMVKEQEKNKLKGLSLEQLIAQKKEGK